MKLFVVSLMLLGILCFTEARKLLKCGTKGIGKERIVGGKLAEKGSWPWQVAVGVRRGRNQFCGGSIIAPNWIVTAAHCFQTNPVPRHYIVTAGEHNLRKKEGDEQVMEVERIIKHPNYHKLRNHKFDYDITLMKLKKSIKYNDKVRPVCLPSRSFPAGTNCYVTGWGRVQERKRGGSSILRQARVPLVSENECRKYNRLTSRMICAGFERGSIDSCKGDSGGPLVCKNRSGVWDLAGIVSFGRGCARPRTYGVYADVVDLKAWIEKTMKSN